MRSPADVGKYLSGRVLGVYSMPERHHRKRGCLSAPITEQSMTIFVPSCAVTLMMVTIPTLKLGEISERGMCSVLKPAPVM